MSGNPRRWLRESLQKFLIPAFEERGFKVVPLVGEEARSREFQTAFPFGTLKRLSAHGSDLVEIQLHKRSAAFRLNIGTAPVSGIDHPLVGRIGQEDIRVHYLARYFTAYSSPFWQRWFAVRRGWFESSATKRDYENLVADNLGLVREVEDLLREGKRGRHIRVYET